MHGQISDTNTLKDQDKNISAVLLKGQITGRVQIQILIQRPRQMSSVTLYCHYIWLSWLEVLNCLKCLHVDKSSLVMIVEVCQKCKKMVKIVKAS